MKKNTFVLLLLAALVMLAAAWYLSPKTQPKSQVGQLMLPQLSAQLDQVDRVDIVTAGNQVAVSLRKDQQSNLPQWGVAERDGYPIKLDMLRSVLRALALLETGERMTAKPEYHSKLHLRDVADENSAARALRVYQGETLVTGLLVGKQIYRGNNNHTYLRVEKDPQSWLVEGELDLPLDPSQWLSRDILDWPTAEIDAIRIQHPDGEVLQVKRAAPEEPYLSVQDLPQGAELKYASVGNSPAEALLNLTFTDVQAASSFDWNEEAVVKTRFTRANGLQLNARAERRGSEYYLQLSAAYAGDNETLQQTADKLNQRLQPWVFQIQTYKYQAMSKRMDDMLKQPASPQGDLQTTP